MWSIRSYFQKFRAHIRYQLDDLFSRNSSSQLILLVLLSFIVVLFGMTAYYFGLFSPANDGVAGIGTGIDRGFWDTLWWSLRHLIDPGVFAENYGATGPVVIMSLVIAIAGMVIFGILIGLISTSMETRLASLKEGNSPVKETGQILILGWSNKIILILRMLATTQPGLRVVVLARPRILEMQEALRADGILALPIKVILRSGNPSNLRELRRVAFDHARSIIVLANWNRSVDASSADVDAIKTAMLSSAFTDWAGQKPVIVSEISRKQNVEIARIAGREEISVVSSSEVISKIIVQAARQSGLSRVYSEILSAEANSIHVAHKDGFAGKRFGDIAYGLTDAVPIGICWKATEDGAAGFAAGLNPEPDYTIDVDDKLVLISRSADISFDSGRESRRSRPSRPSAMARRALNRILVLGFNDNVYGILNEFDGHAAAGTRIDIASNYDEDEAREKLGRNAIDGLTNIEMSFQSGDTVSAEFLGSLDVTSYECIITLADESNDDDADARTIMVLLLLSDLIGPADEADRIHLVSEIHDPMNRDLVARTTADEVVVSPEIVSMQLTQVSQQPVLDSIYRELLSAGGIEICLKPVSDYVDPGESYTFDDLQFAAQAKIEVALGVLVSSRSQKDMSEDRVHLNPSRETTWQFSEDDSVVVLAQEMYK